VKKLEFPTEKDFKEHLALTGETMADQLFRSRIKLLSEEIEKKVLLSMKGLTPQQRAQAGVTFGKEFPKRWAARISCMAKYVVPTASSTKDVSSPKQERSAHPCVTQCAAGSGSYAPVKSQGTRCPMTAPSKRLRAP
jgi:hypothetical protein